MPINAPTPQLDAHGAHVRSVVVVGAAVSYSLAPHTVKLVHWRSFATVHGPEMNVPDGHVVEHASHERSDVPWQRVRSKNPERQFSEQTRHVVSLDPPHGRNLSLVWMTCHERSIRRSVEMV